MISEQDKKIKEIVERYPEFWKSTSQFMSFIRSGVRLGLWNKHKVKLLKIKNNREQIPNHNPRGNKPTVWGGRCEVCSQLFVTSELQVDHIRQEGSSLKCFDDLAKFIEDMVLITEDDLRIVCKGCHAIISHSQKQGISFEEAKAEKEALQLIKEKKDKDYCIQHNIPVQSTQSARRKAIVEFKLSQLKEKMNE